MKHEFEIALGILAVLVGVVVGMHVGSGVICNLMPSVVSSQSIATM